jgi:CO/xanthine dehydrogenase FAD-binding subunit
VYWRPTSLEEALAILSEAPEARALAGGTDLFPARVPASTWGAAPREALLDLSRVEGLDAITLAGGAYRLGARVTWARLRDDAALPPGFRALRQAARQVGGRQVQARGTLGGNLCNASPAADGVPPLLVLDAEVELASAARGTRRLPLRDFLLGNRRTARRADELLTAILVPEATAADRSVFLKLGARSHLVISIAMVAAATRVEGGRIAAARVAVGACSAVARRLPGLEAKLVGLRPEEARVALEDLSALSPIADVRADARYRREAARELAQRALAA